jgi:ArsR family transcriptional regulator
MQPKTSEQIADLLKCLAHPVKLDIIKLLGANEHLTVSEIQSLLGCNCEQSMLSHHLIKMKDRGVLSSLKNGKFIYYKLENKKTVALVDLMAQL